MSIMCECERVRVTIVCVYVCLYSVYTHTVGAGDWVHGDRILLLLSVVYATFNTHSLSLSGSGGLGTGR
jgi:hypothetical protein